MTAAPAPAAEPGLGAVDARARRGRLPRRAALATALAATLLALLRPAAPADEEIVWRLVDAAAADTGGPAAAVELRAETAARRGPARAVIDDDQRYTFARARAGLLHRAHDLALPDAETLALEVPLPPILHGCRSLIADVAMTGREARDTRSVLARCTGAAAARSLAITAPIAPILRGRTVDLWINVRRLPAAAVEERRFAIRDVPRRARLVFAYGVEAPGWAPNAAAVAFEVAVAGEPTPRFRRVLDPARNAADRHWQDAEVSFAGDAHTTVTLVLRTSMIAAPGRDPVSVPVWGDPTVVAARGRRARPRAAGPHTAAASRDAGAGEDLSLSRADRSERGDGAGSRDAGTERGGGHGRDGGTSRPLDLLVVEIDTLRARSVGAYGGRRPTTPFLDALARRGVLFETVVAQSTLTPVSNMSLFTGLYPRAHGVTDLSRPSDLERYATIAELLRAAGYATGAVTEDGLLAASLGFERGFDRYRENKSADLASTVGHVEGTFEAGVAWMRAHCALPFFLFLHTYQVHAPYTPPPPYRGRFGAATATAPAADLDRYEEEIRYVDDQLARLWSALEALDLAERTIVIVTSDHGEEFGEHGVLDHGSHLYDETLLVPLVLHLPGRDAGLRVREPVALVDVLPTVLDLLALPPLAGGDGRSLAALTRDRDPARAALAAALARRAIFAEAWGATRVRADGSLDPEWHPPAYALRTPALKLIATSSAGAAGRLEAYDLRRDPAERHDVAAAEPDRIAAGVAALERYRRRAAALADAAAAGRRAAPRTAPPDAATAEKLKALGYVR